MTNVVNFFPTLFVQIYLSTFAQGYVSLPESTSHRSPIDSITKDPISGSQWEDVWLLPDLMVAYNDNVHSPLSGLLFGGEFGIV